MPPSSTGPARRSDGVLSDHLRIPDDSDRPVLRQPIMIFSIVVALLNTVLFAVGIGAGRVYPYSLHWLSGLVLIPLTILMCFRAVKASPHGSGSAKYWRVSGAGMVAILLAIAVRQVNELHPLQQLVDASNGLEGVGGLLMGIATLRMPLGIRSRADKVALILDMCTVAVGACTLLFYFFANAADHAVRAGTVTSVAPLVGITLLAVFFTVKAAMAGSVTLPRVSLGLNVVGGLVGGLGAAVAMLWKLPNGMDFLMLFNHIANITMTLSAGYAIAAHRAGRRPRVVRGRYSTMPYFAAAAVSALLVYVSVREAGDVLMVVVASAVLIITLVIIRQMIVYRENVTLLSRIGTEERRFRLMVQNSADVVLITEIDGRIRYASPALARTLGHDLVVALGSPVTDLIHPQDRDAARAALTEAGTQDVTFQVRLLHADGSWRWFETITSDLTHEPSVAGRVTNARDITETKLIQDQLHHDATHDALTGLANRTLFSTRIESRTAPGGPGHRFSLVLVDLDDFKIINDTLGHTAGDCLLVTVARRMSEAVRPVDSVARLGGDEFAILMDDLDPADADRAVQRIAAALREPIAVDGRKQPVKASFGIVEGRPGDDPGDLMRRADIAMYDAKGHGKGRLSRYRDGMEQVAAQRERAAAELAAAIDNDELVLFYQPVVALPTGTMIGVEALVRWQHPERGLLGPGEFVEEAERNGLILGVGRWVLREAVRQAAAWITAHGDRAPEHVAVNASARQLQEAGFADEVAQALTDFGLPAHRLTVEITESTAVGGGATAENLNDLRTLGVRLSLDDFGTGASTLTLLNDCPVHELKLDRAFVPEPGVDLIAGLVVHLADAIGAGMVAEGVETEEQATRLFGLGYRRAQGFLYARPLPAAEIDARVRATADLDGTVDVSSLSAA